MKMYEVMERILKKSEADSVDVGVAYDKLAVDGNREELKEAYTALHENFTEITALRNMGRHEDVRAICELYEKGEKTKVKEYINNLVENGVLEG